MAVIDRYYDDSASASASDFDYSDNESYTSCHSQTTASTKYSPTPSVRGDREKRFKIDHDHDAHFSDFRDSAASFTSSFNSHDEFDDGTEEFEVPPAVLEVYQSDATPSTPEDFANLFPSTRRLPIAHDDATTDGNMNLRIDTFVTTPGGEQEKVILFHLKMEDLKTRKCSLRRYCRDSGREICHSECRSQAPEVQNRFSLKRSLTSALSFRSKSNVTTLPSPTIQRQDSGYASMFGDDEESHIPPVSPASTNDNTVSLEFSNYTHLDVRRQGFGAEKKYEFEYWGNKYSWQKTTRRQASRSVVSFTLIRQKDNSLIASIDPTILTSEQMIEEIAQGGWIPPCSMQIIDEQVIHAAGDVSDVVVATGLMALVDDSIRRRFQSKSRKQLVLPTAAASHMAKHLDFISPKRLIDEAFWRGKPANAAR